MAPIPIEWLVAEITTNDVFAIVAQILRLAGCSEADLPRMIGKVDYDLEEEIKWMINNQTESTQLWYFASGPTVPGDKGGGVGLVLRNGDELLNSNTIMCNPGSVRHPLEGTNSPGNPHPLKITQPNEHE